MFNFYIGEGIQRGEVFSVPHNSHTTVGRSTKNSVVLRTVEPIDSVVEDADSQGTYFSLTYTDHCLMLKSFIHGIFVDGEELGALGDTELSGGEIIQLGDCELFVDAAEKLEKAIEEHEQFDYEEQDFSLVGRVVTYVREHMSPVGIATVLLFAVVVSSLISLLFIPLYTSETIAKVPDESNRDLFILRDNIQSKGFLGVSVTQTDQGMTLNGWVNSNEDLMEINKMLKKVKAATTNLVQSTTATTASVSDFLRINSIQSEVEMDNFGNLNVHVPHVHNDAASSLKNVIMQEFNQVRSVSLTTDLAIAKTSEAERAIDNDKKSYITMIVASGSPHFITKDGSIYFVGSVLPSGPEVAGIESDKIHIRQDGVISTINF